jgi:hypothetical protein
MLWSEKNPHGAAHTGLGFCFQRALLFTPGHAHQLTSSGWQVGWFLLWLIPCLFGETGIEPAELDLWSERNPIVPVLPLIPETRNLQIPGFWTKGKVVQWDFSLIMLSAKDTGKIGKPSG